MERIRCSGLREPRYASATSSARAVSLEGPQTEDTFVRAQVERTSGRTVMTGDGVRLHVTEWLADSPVLTLALIHGYAEHAGRYERFARALNARGISVVAVDLRGHGRSEGPRGHVTRFEDYHHDVDALLDVARSRAGGGPVGVFAHSLGGLIAEHWQLEHPSEELCGVVLSSPFLGLSIQASPIKLAAGRVLSTIVPKASLPSGLTGGDAARDPEIARAYDVDPLVNKRANARWFTESLRAIEDVHAGAGELTHPTLLLYGGDDRIASADDTDRFASKLSMPDRESERIKGAYHEILNEPVEARARIVDRVAGWLLARTGHSC